MRTATIYLRGVMTDHSPEGRPVDPWLRLENIEVVEVDLDKSSIEQLRDGSICVKTAPVSAGAHPTGYLSERIIPAWRLIEYQTHEVAS